MKIFGEKYRRLVVVILAIIGVLVMEYFPSFILLNTYKTYEVSYSSYIFLFIAFIYTLYAVYSSYDLSVSKKILKGIVLFFTTVILYSIVEVTTMAVTNVNDKPAYCNSSRVKDSLTEMIKEDRAFKDSKKYKIASVSKVEYDEKENIYYCRAVLDFDIENNEHIQKEKNIVMKEALINMTKALKRTLDYKVYIEGDYSIVEILD